MQLIGMLDSPYVRRVAIALQLLGLPFTHRSVSVFRGYDDFSRINPVVKAPTLVCDDGTVLMDSTLILQLAEQLARPRSLLPAGTAALQHDLRVSGLALAACEKAVQLVYEDMLRPEDKRHAPWVARVGGQLRAALSGLEAELRRQPPEPQRLTQGGVTAAVAWHFTRQLQPVHADAAAHPALAAWSASCEALPAFAAAPHGDGVVQAEPGKP